MSTNVVADRGAVAVQEKQRAKSRLGRILWVTGAIVGVMLVVAYLGISGYMSDKLTHPDRKALEGSPTQYGMQYQDVTFNSTVDNVPLSGWFIDSPGDKAIIMISLPIVLVESKSLVIKLYGLIVILLLKRVPSLAIVRLSRAFCSFRWGGKYLSGRYGGTYFWWGCWEHIAGCY